MKITRKTFKKIKVFFVSLILLSAVGGVWYLYYRTEVFSITKYTFTGIEDGDHKEVLERALLDVASTTPYRFLPPTKVLTFQKYLLVDTVQKIIPEVRSVYSSARGLHTVNLTISEHSPLFRINDEEVLSKEGFLFRTQKDVSVLPFFSMASSTRLSERYANVPSSRLQNIEKSTLENLSDFEKKISKVIFKVGAITVDDIGDVVFVGKDSGSKVMITKDADMEKTWLTLLSAIDTDPLKSKLEKERGKLLYLDVRFGNKVFYKFLTNEED